VIVSRETLPFFTALASETRLHIVELLCRRKMNISELAKAIGLSSTIVARHISTLEKANLVRCESIAGRHGTQKVCSLVHIGLALRFESQRSVMNMGIYEIPVGQFATWSVEPTCGLCTTKSIIGYLDDPRYFADPRRTDAKLIWVGHGYIEYYIPNYIDDWSTVHEIRIQLEICSEAPGFEAVWPSDIYFSINGQTLGFWTSPSDYGDKPGLFSPEWYSNGSVTEYGQLKTIRISREGTFVDGEKLSSFSIGEIALARAEPIRFRIESPSDCKNPRGFTIFGKGFGNYNQDIVVTIIAADATTTGKED